MTDAFAMICDNNHPIHQLGRYTAWRLRDGADVFTDTVWISIADERSPAAHRILPHGEPSVTIRRRRDRQGDISAIDLLICGPFRNALWYRPSPREELISVRLKPEMSAAAFGLAPGDYVNETLAPAPVNFRNICSNALRFAETENCYVVAGALYKDLRRHAAFLTAETAPEIAAAGALRDAEGRISNESMAYQLGVSERHLRRRFRDRLGCTPKTYARQLRLTAAMQTAERNAKPKWADIATAVGFHDQAHMINEFKAMTGLTPQHIHSERRILSGFSNTAASV